MDGQSPVMKVTCGECGEELTESQSLPESERLPCPKCASIARHVFLNATDSFTFHEMGDLKGKRPGQKKPYIERRQGDSLFRKTGEWHDLSRVVDRENDHYSEKVTDPKTGEVIHECEEPLSEHQWHGDAKRKRPPK